MPALALARVTIDNARALEESERRRAWTEGALRVAAALAPSLQADVPLDPIVDEVRALSGARSASLVRGQGELIEVVASSGAAEDLAVTVDRLATEIRAAVAGGERGEVPDGAGRSAIIVPIPTNLAPAAALLVDHIEGWASPGDLDRELVGSFAGEVGLALDRAQAVRDRHELLVAKDRDRIARDLHDLVIQRLFATGMRLQGVRSIADLEEVREHIGAAVSELDTAISDVRATIFELGHGAGRSLHEDVRALIDEYAPMLGFVPVLRLSGPVDNALTQQGADALLMALRESLSNIARHAHASSASVELAASSRWFSLRVTDDGVGFDPGSVLRGQGLDNALHRAESLGGHVDLRSRTGEGTRMEWVVPAIS